MPTISKFFGIEIRMYWYDHNQPHFHAFYGGQGAKFGIRSLRKIKGRLSKRAERLVLEWASIHQAELLAEWEILSQGMKPVKIRGLE